MDATGAIVSVEPRNVDAAPPADTAVNPACTPTTIDQGSHIHCRRRTKNYGGQVPRMGARAAIARSTGAHGDCSSFGLTPAPTWNRSLLASVLVTIPEGHHLYRSPLRG